MNAALTEVRQLFRNLQAIVARLCQGTEVAEPDRLEIYRLLHSLKAWAVLEGKVGLELTCHGLEDLIRDHPQLGPAEMAVLTVGIGDMELGLAERAPLGLDEQEPRQPSPNNGVKNVWWLSAPHPAFSARDLRLVNSLKEEGRGLRCCRVWISPDEPLPLTRLLVLHTRFESLGLIRAELWVAWEGRAQGPFEPREYLLGQSGVAADEGQGGWYRCYYSPLAGRAGLPVELDLVEGILDDAYPGVPWLAGDFRACPLELLELDRVETAAQAYRCAAWGKSANEGRSLLMGELAARPVAGWLPGLAGRFLPLLAEHGLPEQTVRWQLFDEGQSLPAAVLATLEEITLQLIRNSLAHGLEPVETRLAARKPAALRIGISLIDCPRGLRFRYQDDGTGLDLPAIAARAGRTPESLADPATVLDLICQAEFSTKDSGDRHAGRGIGLNLVAQLARDVLGATLSLENRPGEGLAMQIDFSRELEGLAVQFFRSGTGLMALPQVSLASVVPWSAEQLRKDRNSKCHYSWAGLQLPVLTGWEDWRTAPLLAVILRQGEVLEGLLPVSAYEGGEWVVLRPGQSRVFFRRGRAWADLYPAP